MAASPLPSKLCAAGTVSNGCPFQHCSGCIPLCCSQKSGVRTCDRRSLHICLLPLQHHARVLFACSEGLPSSLTAGHCNFVEHAPFV